MPDTPNPLTAGRSLSYHPFMNVVLHKNGSGVWGLAQKGRNLRGWQRLWLVTGVTYLFMLVAAGWLLWPERRQVDKAMVFAVTEEVRRYDGLAFVGDSPEKIFEAAQSQGYAPWIARIRRSYRIGKEGDDGFARIEREYRQAIESLTMKRLKLLVGLSIAWVVPMGLLYAVGGLIGWITKGAL